MKTYCNIKGLKDNEQLKISYSYQKPQRNSFYGTEEKGGLYIHFTPVELKEENGYVIEKYLMISDNRSFKIRIKDLTRNSKKQRELLEDWIYDNETIISDKYEQGLRDMDFSELIKYIKNY